MTNLKDVSIYNLKNEVVLHKLDGIFKQEKTLDAFVTNLKLDGTGDALVKGESYYAVGIKDDNCPVRSETVKCMDNGRNPMFEGILKFPERPADFVPRRGGAPADSQADMLIQYTNYSNTQFERSTWGYNLQDGFGNLTVAPGTTLLAHSGQQAIGANQILGAVDEGPADIYLCWAATTNFGVWIHFNFQMFGIGPRPIWYVTTNGSAWTLSGSDPAFPYTWNAGAVGFNIVGTPTSGHSSLTVGVVITDLGNEKA